METAKSHNAKYVGQIDLPKSTKKILASIFNQGIVPIVSPKFGKFAKENGFVEGKDFLVDKYGIGKSKRCIQCLKLFWDNNGSGEESDPCEDCRKENLRKLVEQNKDNL